MPNRSGVFIGFYGPPELKKELKKRARAEHRSLSAEVKMRLEQSLKREGGQGEDESQAGREQGGGIGLPTELRRPTGLP